MHTINVNSYQLLFIFTLGKKNVYLCKKKMLIRYQLRVKTPVLYNK